MSTTVSDARSTLSDSPVVRAGVAVVLAVAVNVGIVLLAEANSVAPVFRALSVPPVAFLSAVGAVGAAVVYELLRRRSATPDRTFRRVAGAVLVVSLVPDVALLVVDDAATLAGVLVLMVMHAVVAAVCVTLVPRGARGESAPGPTGRSTSRGER
jgi:CDP-diglyceride synthetase